MAMQPEKAPMQLHSRLWSCSELEHGMHHLMQIKEELPEEALEGYLKERLVLI